jgi:hypothetical protein
MKRVFTLVFVIGFITYSIAQVNNNIPTNQNSQGTGPSIKFVETSHDFGNINEGIYAKYSFKFFNVGEKPLVIKSVNASCGCTAPSWPKNPLMPGDSNTIIVVFNSRGYGGNNFQKSITVTTNMEKDGVLVLFIRGHVIKVENPPANPTQSPVQLNPH